MLSIRGMKKVFSVALTGIMAITLVPASAFAEPNTGSDALSVAETVDSTSLGVNLGVFDYSNAANIGGQGYVSGDGRIRQGLLSSVLGEDGFPVASSSGLSLKEWYSEEGSGVKDAYLNCNNLFLKSIYDSTGYLTYSSFDNFAELNTTGSSSDVHNFTVYNQLGTPNNGGDFFYKRGNFLPLNKITEGKLSTNTNSYDMDGKKLDSNASRYNESLYLVNNTNYYFGMYMSTGFNMLKDGQYNESDMIYEFNGDDDLWIYIDGVLVLDIGGIHDAHSGKINFATGDIVEDTSSQTAESKNATTLKQRFIDAGVEEAKISSLFGDKNTFADNSSHVLKMFYMERGAGASNCYIKINLPTIPEEKVEVPGELVPEEEVPVAVEPSEEAPVIVENQEEAPAVTEDSEALQQVVNTETPEVNESVQIEENETPNDETPKTGDTINLILIISIAFVSFGIVGIMILDRRRNRI